MATLTDRLQDFAVAVKAKLDVQSAQIAAFTAGVFPWWGKNTKTAASTEAAGSVHGIWWKVANAFNPGYGFYTEYDNTGNVSGQQNDITQAWVTRHKSITLGASWAGWHVSLSPLNPSSGFTNAPGSAQTFAMVMAEYNPISRHGDCGLALDARHWVNWHGGIDMVPETFDPYSELGGERRGYHIPFAYGVARSPRTATDTGKHAKTYFPFFTRPNTVAVGGATVMAQGFIPYVLTIAISAAGSGYVVGNLLTFSSGLPLPQNEEAQVEVLTVDGSGAITSARLYKAGYYQANPPSPCPVTGGGGTGATFTWTLQDTTSVPRAAYGIGGGSLTYGLDAGHWSTGSSDPGTAHFLGGMIRAPNNENILLARNAAGSADVGYLKLAADDSWQVGQTGTPMKRFGPQLLNIAEIGNYANDTAAATGGVALGQIYRNGSVLMVRVA